MKEKLDELTKDGTMPPNWVLLAYDENGMAILSGIPMNHIEDALLQGAYNAKQLNCEAEKPEEVH